MKEIILIKNGELALKGLNRGTFEEALLKNLRYRLKPIGNFLLRKAQSTVYIEPQDADVDWDDVSDRVATVFGISAFSRACDAASSSSSMPVMRASAQRCAAIMAISPLPQPTSRHVPPSGRATYSAIPSMICLDICLVPL